MSTPLISVIIPVYNTESYLAECIESILHQQEQSWELILVNDGSRDSSGEICRSFAEKDGRIKYIEQENKGVSAARNNGLRHATGTWFTFVDSDDLLEKFAFSVVRTAPEDCEVVIAGFTDRIGASARMEEGGKAFSAAEIRMSVLNFSQFKKQYPDCTSIDDYSKWSSCGRFYKTDTIKKAGVWVPEQLKLGEDLTFSVKAMEHVKKIWVNDSKIYFYRPNSASASRSFRKDRITNTELLIEEVGNTIDLRQNEKEFYRFVATLLTTCCFSYFSDNRNGLTHQQAADQLKQLCRKKWFAMAIEGCDYHLLAYGKRNRIKIAVTLFCLKCGWYAFLLQSIRAFLWRIN